MKVRAFLLVAILLNPVSNVYASTDIAATQKSAEQGHADAQASIGFMHLQGVGVPQDHRQAAPWIRKVTEQGDARVQAALESMC